MYRSCDMYSTLLYCVNVHEYNCSCVFISWEYFVVLQQQNLLHLNGFYVIEIMQNSEGFKKYIWYM